MRKKLFKPEAIFFDMDGVIVDSMPYHFISWFEALWKIGVRITFFDVYLNEGENWKKSLIKFLKRDNVKPTQKLLDKLLRYKQKVFKEKFERFIFKEVVEYLPVLKKKNIKIGLVTGTHMKAFKKIMPKEIERYFDCVINGDHQKIGKPHPEPYLLAAKKLKVNPSNCIAIENSPFGIVSAKKAGMFCIALCTSLTEEYLKGADVIVKDFKEAKKILEKLF